MKRRFPKLARWLAGIYLVWSLFVFFGSLWGSGHEWWPLFLYPIIWPLSLVFEIVGSRMTPLPISYAMYDYLAGAFYIIAGTIWVWCLGRVFSMVVTHIFPLRDDKIAA
jgi:hypothetical protein